MLPGVVLVILIDAVAPTINWLQLLPSVLAVARLKLSSSPSVGNAGLMVSVSVALLLPVFGSVVPPAAATVAVLTKLPEALDARVVLAVNVALPPESRVTVPVRFTPVPLAVQLEPAVAVHVQLPTV